MRKPKRVTFKKLRKGDLIGAFEIEDALKEKPIRLGTLVRFFWKEEISYSTGRFRNVLYAEILWNDGFSFTNLCEAAWKSDSFGKFLVVSRF